MTDDQYLSFLMFVTREIQAYRKSKMAQGMTSPNTFTIEEEPFSRWMEWRGEEAQQEECSWSQSELKAERQARHMKRFGELEKENMEMRRFLWDLRKGLDRFLESWN